MWDQNSQHSSKLAYLICECFLYGFIYVSRVPSTDEKVMADDEFTCDLFRFLQLLCEGHNNGEFLQQTLLLPEQLPYFCLHWGLNQKLSTSQTVLRFSDSFLLTGPLTFLEQKVVFVQTVLWNVMFFCLFSDFQNYLRTQTGSTTTINVIICTVDYLLRLQVTRMFLFNPLIQHCPD